MLPTICGHGLIRRIDHGLCEPDTREFGHDNRILDPVEINPLDARPVTGTIGVVQGLECTPGGSFVDLLVGEFHVIVMLGFDPDFPDSSAEGPLLVFHFIRTSGDPPAQARKRRAGPPQLTTTLNFQTGEREPASDRLESFVNSDLRSDIAVDGRDCG